MPSLVKVRSFLGVAEAELARARLAMDGIPARLSNANLLAWAWYYSNATGGVKLFVNDSDASRAAIVLSPQPVPEQFQPPQWHCPHCQADVDGLWSYCWSCGTSKHGEPDPDFHTWYQESGGSLARKSSTEVISVIISVMFLVVFIAVKSSPWVILAWLATLTFWVLISRLLGLQNAPMFNPAETTAAPEDRSHVQYDPSRDEFNPADDMAYRLWNAAIFTIGEWFFIYFVVALWLWLKTTRNVSLLSDKGLSYYYYALPFMLINFMFCVWIFLLLMR